MNIIEQMHKELENNDALELAKKHSIDYISQINDRNVYPTKQALDNLSFFDEDLPSQPADNLQLLNDLHQYGSPASVAQTGGRYFGLVNGGMIPVSLAVSWLVSTWDQNVPLHVTSPINAKLESVCEKWLQQVLGLPSDTVAGFVSGSSMAIFCGLAAARYRLYQNLNWDINSKGFAGAPKIRIIASKHAHGTVLKAIALLGLGTDNIEWLDVDTQGRAIASSLPELDQSCLVILQAGNVNSGSFDPFEIICQKAKLAGAWVHIDGAFGLWAAASKQLAHLTKGMDGANSWSVDGHKTLNTPYDNGILLCRDKEALTHALHAAGSYIVYGNERDGMLYTPEMSRRARAVELWAVMKYLGSNGISELIDNLHCRTKQFANELKGAGFKILNDIVFNQIIIEVGDEDIRDRFLKHIQQSGECWVGGSQWFDKPVIRISVCSWVTTDEDVSRSVNAFVDAMKYVKSALK